MPHIANLGQELQQTQQLSVLQMQYLRLLQMNTLELNAYLEEIQLENPLLEVTSPDALLTGERPSAMELAKWVVSSRERKEGERDPNADEDIPSPEELQPDTAALYDLDEYIKSQIDLSVDGEEYRMIDYLIGFLDANGYLKVTAEQLAQEFSCDISLAEEAIGYLQTLDPPGIGAADLTECLQIQLVRMGVTDDAAMLLCSEESLSDLAHGHYQKLSRALGVDVERVTTLYALIRTLDPRPASSFGAESTAVMIPDFTVTEDESGLSCRCNKQYTATLSINRDYLSLGDDDEAAKDYLSRKISQAMWLVRAVQSRQDTIERIVGVLLEVQAPFFLPQQGALVPLKLSDVASRIGVHESTVSRAISEKYLQCRHGVFPLKHFFSAAIPSGEGEMVSSRSVKSLIRSLIAEEDAAHPLSDSAIVTLLRQRGIKVARRTVAKYREELGIASSTARRR